MIGLVDADLITYRCGFAAEKRVKVQHEDHVEHVREVGPLSHALQNVDTVMDSLKNKFGKLECFLSGKGNWRVEFATVLPYKGNRSPFGRPVHYKAIRKHLVDKWGAVVVDGMEADDALGIRQTGRHYETDPYVKQGPETCIISTDKDMLQIPGSHYNWVKDESKYIDERESIRNFYAQVLSGDRIDNIPGIYGIGTERAKRILQEVSTDRGCWQAVKRAWHDHYPDGYDTVDGRRRPVDEVLVEVASLLWIARHNQERWREPTGDSSK